LRTLEELARGKAFRELLEIYRRIQEGELVIEDPSPPRDFLERLARPDYSSWLWAVWGLTLLTLASIPLSSALSPLLVLRHVLGAVFVLFLPGYVTVKALYPGRSELSDLERLALSLGLSLALVPLIGLILNFTPWGIRLAPVAASLSAYTLALSLVAAYREHALSRSGG